MWQCYLIKDVLAVTLFFLAAGWILRLLHLSHYFDSGTSGNGHGIQYLIGDFFNLWLLRLKKFLVV